MRSSGINPSMVIGIGNKGRRDDGLGWAFLDWLAEREVPQKLVYRYQLQVEDAEMISSERQVLFVDADQEDLNTDFRLEEVKALPLQSYTSHSLRPGEVLALCGQLFDTRPEAYVLRIRGYEWELKEGLTEQAARNLRTTCNADVISFF